MLAGKQHRRSDTGQRCIEETIQEDTVRQSALQDWYSLLLGEAQEGQRPRWGRTACA